MTERSPRDPSPRPLRLAVYSDFAYRRDGDAVWAQEAFALFCARLSECVDRLVLVGRLDPRPGRWHYRLPGSVEFAPLPHYAELSHPLAAVRGARRSLLAFWRALDGVDAVWLLGPHPLALAFAALAALRGRRVALGVRQDFPRYVRNRHPGRRGLYAGALVLEGAYRLLARACPTAVVGPDLARRYGGARRLLEISISLVSERDIVSPAGVRDRPYDGEVRALNVGRIAAEKNPLMLAEVLARLDGRWRLVVAGEGPLEDELARRLREAGLEERADLRGYLPLGDELLGLYRTCHVFLHVSWTEGVPQVLFEALAAGLPVVATAVGGVREAVDGAAVLVPPGDPGAAASALARVAGDPQLREALIDAGLELVRGRTSELECGRLARFLAGSPRRGEPASPVGATRGQRPAR